MAKMSLSVGEIMDLAAWIEQLGMKRDHPVEIEQEPAGGIGIATTVKIKTTEDSGVFKDITDYDLW